MKINVMTLIILNVICILSIVLILKNDAADLDSKMRFKREDSKASKNANPIASTTVGAETDAEYTDTWTASTENSTDANTTEWLTTSEVTETTEANKLELRVVVNPNVIQVKRGETVELNCIVYGGDSNTNIFWMQEKPKRRFALTDKMRKTDKKIIGTKVTLKSRIKLDNPNKIGSYTCMAQNKDGTAASAVLKMQQRRSTIKRKRSLANIKSEYVISCQPNEIDCLYTNRRRKCIDKFLTCDGDRDCDNGSDEQQHYCDLFSRQSSCKPSEFQCLNNNDTYGNAICIRRSRQCDGLFDCPDRSDEIGCVKPTVISTVQRHIEINSGDTLTIRCTVHGLPTPYINWRHQWGHICSDGYDNGRCTTKQSIDTNNRAIVTGIVTIRNVSVNDVGQYSCEAHNNQGFIIAIPDTIVHVTDSKSINSTVCNCNGHSLQCTQYGLCLNCQHNTDGPKCEYCAQGYTGDARRGTQDDCQSVPVISNQSYNEISEISINSNYYYRMTNEYIGKNFALEVINRNGDYAITMAPINNNSGQYWRIVPFEKNIYSLRTRLLNDSYSAEIIYDKTYIKIHMAPTTNSIEQRWHLLAISNRTFRLANKLSGNTKYLNVYPDTMTVFMDSDADHYNQQYWNLTKITEVFHD